MFLNAVCPVFSAVPSFHASQNGKYFNQLGGKEETAGLKSETASDKVIKNKTFIPLEELFLSCKGHSGGESAVFLLIVLIILLFHKGEYTP